MLKQFFQYCHDLCYNKIQNIICLAQWKQVCCYSAGVIKCSTIKHTKYLLFEIGLFILQTC